MSDEHHNDDDLSGRAGPPHIDSCCWKNLVGTECECLRADDPAAARDACRRAWLAKEYPHGMIIISDELS
ncbi:MAG TPA: hypothetical protein VGJ20_28825 [Xanthobacteraceae bacterium]|jgi:hypothetical protein